MHFVNVGQNLAKRIENCEGIPTQFLRSTPVASFVMSCVAEIQVCSLFKCLRGSLPKSGPLDFATKNTFPLFFVGEEALVGIY